MEELGASLEAEEQLKKDLTAMTEQFRRKNLEEKTLRKENTSLKGEYRKFKEQSARLERAEEKCAQLEREITQLQSTKQEMQSTKQKMGRVIESLESIVEGQSTNIQALEATVKRLRKPEGHQTAACAENVAKKTEHKESMARIFHSIIAERQLCSLDPECILKMLHLIRLQLVGLHSCHSQLGSFYDPLVIETELNLQLAKQGMMFNFGDPRHASAVLSTIKSRVQNHPDKERLKQDAIVHAALAGYTKMCAVQFKKQVQSDLVTQQLSGLSAEQIRISAIKSMICWCKEHMLVSTAGVPEGSYDFFLGMIMSFVEMQDAHPHSSALKQLLNTRDDARIAHFFLLDQKMTTVDHTSIDVYKESYKEEDGDSALLAWYAWRTVNKHIPWSLRVAESNHIFNVSHIEASEHQDQLAAACKKANGFLQIISSFWNECEVRDQWVILRHVSQSLQSIGTDMYNEQAKNKGKSNFSFVCKLQRDHV